jgi:hypothetical protein
MPFTFAHPALVTPLHKRGFVLSALVVGSMAPDLGFYLSLGPIGNRSHHNLADLFTFCIPAGFLALWVFHRVLKQPLLGLLPLPLQTRLQPYAQPFAFAPCRRLLLILASLLVGALSHLAWDFFCHTPGWSGWTLAFLTTPVILSKAIGSIRVVEVLHGVFSIIGLAFLATQAGRLLLPSASREEALCPPSPGLRANPGLMGIVLLLSLAVVAFFTAAAGSLFLAHPFSDEKVRRLALYRTVVLTVTFLFGELLLFSLAMHIRRLLKRQPGRRETEMP